MEMDQTNHNVSYQRELSSTEGAYSLEFKSVILHKNYHCTCMTKFIKCC